MRTNRRRRSYKRATRTDNEVGRSGRIKHVVDDRCDPGFRSRREPQRRDNREVVGAVGGARDRRRGVVELFHLQQESIRLLAVREEVQRKTTETIIGAAFDNLQEHLTADGPIVSFLFRRNTISPASKRSCSVRGKETQNVASPEHIAGRGLLELQSGARKGKGTTKNLREHPSHQQALPHDFSR